MASPLIVIFLALAGPALGRCHDTEITAEQALAVQKLRTHCKACHALGELRFLPSEDDSVTWDFVLHERSPRSGKLWVEAIREVLDWPTDDPPPFDQLMAPPDRDWMPKGYKRIVFARDVVEGEPTRRFLLRVLPADW